MTRKQRREQLLDIGRALFAERGFDGTSIEEIASRAGVSKPVVYEHIGGKEGLYAVVVDRDLFLRVLEDVWEAAATDPAPRSRRLEVERIHPWLELRVVREADPIDPVALQTLFEPFDLKADDTGITIGLYLARALTVAHGGALGVEQDDDKATLWVRLPLMTAGPR